MLVRYLSDSGSAEQPRGKIPPAVKRRLLTLAAAASLVLCLATVALSSLICLTATALLIRSFFVCDIVGASVIEDRPDFYGLRQFLFQSNRGYLTLVAERESASEQQWASVLRQLVRRRNKGQEPARLWRERWDATDAGMPFRWKSLGIGTDSQTRTNAPAIATWVQHQRSVWIPHAYLVLASALLPSWWMWRRVRSRRHHRAGRCVACGYDLRATPDCCPECGAAPAEPAAR
jgi:hypothetical protein